MRVLLPLKKKQDDPNSQEHAHGEESSETQVVVEEEAGETYVEAATAEAAGDETAVAAEPAKTTTTDNHPIPEASPTAVLLSAAAARLSCLPAPSSPTSSEDTSPVKSPFEPDPALETAGLADFEGRLKQEETTSSAQAQTLADNEKLPFKSTKPESIERPSEATKLQAKDAVLETVVAPKQDSIRNTAAAKVISVPTLASLSTSPVAAPSTRSIPTLASINTSLAAAPPPPIAANSTRARKRRSSSPPASLDLKPPSKKGRDSKPPAKKEVPNTTPVNSKMAGGSRGGRKVWASGSPTSFYVETNGGREDVPASEEGAEVDVRFTYRPENDPATTRGEASLRASSSAASRNSTPHEVCGRDDEDVMREREPNCERPEAGEEEQQFAVALKKQGLEIVEQDGDGNCLFRAVGLQIFGDASMHEEVRQRCLDFMARDKEHFSQFITDEPFEQYIRRKRQDGVHGNNPEIQAISELFNRPIEVFVPQNGASPLNIFHAEYKTQDAPIRLSYHDGNHYNAVIDPLVPTAGLGLGLPGLQPGLADKMQVAKAVAESDRLADQREFERALEESQNDQLQRAIKESTLSVDHLYQNKALSLSDCDATNFELEQAVLESSLESFRTFEHGRKQASKAKKPSGRRTRQASPPQKSGVAFGGLGGSHHSSVASIPREARQDAGSVPSAASVASIAPSVASAAAPPVASRPSNDDYRPSQADAGPMMAEQYPPTVQELVMNGFELRKVVHAYELVGDNFDDLLAFLMAGGS